MYLYNSLSHKKELFTPIDPKLVKMYTCGPTVYHFAHIGNLRSYIMEDVLEKSLRYMGYPVKRVMNITDVGHLASDADTGEDKMRKGARREHKTVMEIAKFYTDAFFADCAKLNIKRPDVVEPATNCIPEYIHMVQTLLDKGYAYLAGGNVYFDTSKLEKYYVFNDHKEEDLAVGVREGVEEDSNKRNQNDFRGVSAIPAGTSSARASASSISANIWISTAAASTMPSRITRTRSPSPRPSSATSGAITGSMSIT